MYVSGHDTFYRDQLSMASTHPNSISFTPPAEFIVSVDGLRAVRRSEVKRICVDTCDDVSWELVAHLSGGCEITLAEGKTLAEARRLLADAVAGLPLTTDSQLRSVEELRAAMFGEWPEAGGCRAKTGAGIRCGHTARESGLCARHEASMPVAYTAPLQTETLPGWACKKCGHGRFVRAECSDRIVTCARCMYGELLPPDEPAERGAVPEAVDEPTLTEAEAGLQEAIEGALHAAKEAACLTCGAAPGETHLLYCRRERGEV